MRIIKKGFIIISLVIFMISCNDNVPLQKNDLEKYPWLTPFIIGYRNAEFKGFHNVDLGFLEFNYEISSKKLKNAFIRFDSIAEIENWETLKKSEFTREYTRSILINNKYDNQVLMKVEMDTIEQKLLFEIH